MQSGPVDDLNKLYLYVIIKDDFDGYTKFNITDPITVVSNNELENSLISQLNSNNKSSVFIQQISSGSIKFSSIIIAIGDILNQKSLNNNDTKVY